MYNTSGHIMKCFNCPERKTKTIYPTYISDGNPPKKYKYVQKWCQVCGWKSNPVQIPEAI